MCAPSTGPPATAILHLFPITLYSIKISAFTGPFKSPTHIGVGRWLGAEFVGLIATPVMAPRLGALCVFGLLSKVAIRRICSSSLIARSSRQNFIPASKIKHHSLDREILVLSSVSPERAPSFLMCPRRALETANDPFDSFARRVWASVLNIAEKDTCWSKRLPFQPKNNKCDSLNVKTHLAGQAHGLPALFDVLQGEPHPRLQRQPAASANSLDFEIVSWTTTP